MDGTNMASRYIDVKPGDWIRFRSRYYCGGRLAEVHALGFDERSGPYAVTAEGNVALERILEIRRKPIAVVLMPRGTESG